MICKRVLVFANAFSCQLYVDRRLGDNVFRDRLNTYATYLTSAAERYS
jgi:hypothetical protein